MAWRTAIDDLLATQNISTQGGIVAALKDRGFGVTQATVSRYLAEIGAEKRDGGYRHAPPAELGAPIHSVSVAGGGCMVVVRTAPAHASVVASVIDRELALNGDCVGVLGTIAGDDTVFVALATPTAVGDLYRLLGWRAAGPAGGK
jgi:transcriptional regulator of arginine metabolism